MDARNMQVIHCTDFRYAIPDISRVTEKESQSSYFINREFEFEKKWLTWGQRLKPATTWLPKINILRCLCFEVVKPF